MYVQTMQQKTRKKSWVEFCRHIYLRHIAQKWNHKKKKKNKKKQHLDDCLYVKALGCRSTCICIWMPMFTLTWTSSGWWYGHELYFFFHVKMGMNIMNCFSGEQSLAIKKWDLAVYVIGNKSTFLPTSVIWEKYKKLRASVDVPNLCNLAWKMAFHYKTEKWIFVIIFIIFVAFFFIIILNWMKLYM